MDNNLSPTVQVDFSVDFGPGRLDASAVVPAGQTNLTELLPVLQSLSSSTIDSAVRLVEQQGQSISCRAGCGACCRQLVPLSIFEAQVLADWIHSLPGEQQAALATRFDAALIQLRDCGMLPRLEPAVRSQDRSESRALGIQYLRQRVACPFLENESCSIHPIRPIICREYLVTTPAKNCIDPAQYPVDGVAIPLKLSQTLAEMGAQVDPRSGGWMPLVFLFAWIKSGKGDPGKAVTGNGPDLLYEVIKRTVEAATADAAARTGTST